MKLIVILLSATFAASAGWWANFCKKHLIADDPTQYEEVDTRYLLNRWRSLKTKQRWGKLDDNDSNHLRIIESTLRLRMEFGLEVDRRAIKMEWSDDGA